MLVDAGRLIVHPRCKLLIQTLKNGVWDKNREEFAHSEIGLGHMDALASLVYMNMGFQPWYNQNPIPLDVSNFIKMDMHGSQELEKSPWEEAFALPKQESLLDELLPEIEQIEDYF